MLRDERQTALNDVVIACSEAAEGHAGAADMVEERDLARVLATLAEQRTAAAAELGEHVRRLGDLPKEPDSDLSTIRDLVARLGAAFSEDERARLIEARERAEAVVEEAVAAALEHEPPAPTQELLARIREEARLARERLISWRARSKE